MAQLGIDEVGRGPWAGPLVIGAVILPEGKAAPEWVGMLRDSKRLTPRRREALAERILAEAAATGLGWVSAAEIDAEGLAGALRLAARRAIEDMREHYPATKFAGVIIDGTQNFLAGTALERRTSTLVKADDAIKEVSAASIIAKVARDRYMCEAAARYPEYGFEKHKGYGTALHKAALVKHGPCPEHRRSFAPVREVLTQNGKTTGAVVKKNTTAVGQRAERAAAAELERRGHVILARNYKTARYEVDVISICADKIYFTEVKYRRDDTCGGGLEAITQAKQKQMRFAATAFLQAHQEFRAQQPILMAADVTAGFRVREIVELD